MSRTILRAALIQFRLGFDRLPESVESVPSIHTCVTHAVPLFPATVLYGALCDDGAVEIIDFDPDDEYFALLDADF